jgi:hypothetical protein
MQTLEVLGISTIIIYIAWIYKTIFLWKSFGLKGNIVKYTIFPMKTFFLVTKYNKGNKIKIFLQSVLLYDIFLFRVLENDNKEVAEIYKIPEK